MGASQWQQDKEHLAHVGGWVSLVVGGLIAPNAVGQAVVLAFFDAPRLDASGIVELVQVYAITAPLAVAATVFVVGAARQWVSGPYVGWFAVVCLLVGAFVGNPIAAGATGAAPVLEENEIAQLAARIPHPLAKAVPILLSLLVGYATYYGWGHFAAALIVGGFAGYAVTLRWPE